MYHWLGNPKVLILTPLMLVLMFAVACGGTAAEPRIIEKEVIVEKQVIKEVPVEIIVVVEKEVIVQVIKEVPVEVIREVIREIPKEVTIDRIVSPPQRLFPLKCKRLRPR